jgi:hypothetical protein
VGARRTAIWGSVALVAVIAAILAGRDAGATHPEPRADAHARHVMPASRYAGYPRVAEVYAWAAEIPATLDGLYCYCRCSEHSGHYSLLDCFASDHGAQCDICLSEAVLARQMTHDGKTLDQIRDAIDGLYGT